MIRIKVHSAVDLITNSSTSIYTWYDSAIKPCKEMIDAFINEFGVTEKTADDLFYVDAFCDVYTYTEYLEEYYEEEEDDDESQKIKDLSEEDVKSIIQDVLRGKVEKPEWMKDAEERENYNGWTPRNYIFIEAKDEKHQPIADAIKKFITSPLSDASYDG